MRYTPVKYSARRRTRVIVVRLTADKPNRIPFAAALTRELDSVTRERGADRLPMEGEAIADDDRHPGERKMGVKFAAEIPALPEGGRSRIDGASLNINGATAVTLRFAAANFREANPIAKCEKYLDTAVGKPETILRGASGPLSAV